MSNSFASFLQAMLKRREQDLEASITNEKERRQSMAAMQDQMARMFGYAQDVGAQFHKDQTANMIMNEAGVPPLKGGAFGGRGGANELEMRTQMAKTAEKGAPYLSINDWLADDMPELEAGTVVHNPNTGDLAQWNGMRWGDYGLGLGGKRDDLAPGTIIRHPQTGEAMRWTGSEWEELEEEE